MNPVTASSSINVETKKCIVEKERDCLYELLFSTPSPFHIEKDKYTPNRNHPNENKRLISKCNPKDKEVRKSIKMNMRNYLDAIFAHQGKTFNQNPIEKSDVFEKRNFSIKNTNGNLDFYEINAEVIKNAFCKYELCERYLIKNNWEYIEFDPEEKMIFTKDVINSVFNGNRCETISCCKYNFPQDSAYWNNWWTNQEAQITHYREIIYPLMSNAVLNVLQLLEKQNKTTSPLTIMEIAGGHGELAKIILDSDLYPKNTHYVFLELNEPSLEQARKTLEGYPAVETFQTNLVQDAAYGTVTPFSVDLVLGSGILTYSVLSNELDAKRILEKVNRCLKPGGYLILAGHTSLLLSAIDFTRKGFNVINCMANGKQLYILQKKQALVLNWS